MLAAASSASRKQEKIMRKEGGGSERKMLEQAAIGGLKNSSEKMLAVVLLFVVVSVRRAVCFRLSSTNGAWLRQDRRPLRMTGSQEETLREEIERRNMEAQPDVEKLVAQAEVPAQVLSEVAVGRRLGDAGLLAEKALQLGEDFYSALDKALYASSSKTRAQHPEEETLKKKKKKKMVVLGSGWATASLICGLDLEDVEVTVVSPRMYFLFTPMLCGASVGTVETRSITEPLRNLNRKVRYYEATASEIDFKNSKISCEAVVCEGAQCHLDFFDVDYDVLVSAVGATTNTFGVKGVREYCRFLRQVSDATALRQNVGNCFERANLPGSSVDEKIRALSFVVVGAGPTGVEFCSELRDFLATDAVKFYLELLPFVSVTLLEATNVVLGAFDETLRDVALEELRKTRPVAGKEGETVPAVNVQLTASVKEVNATHVAYSNGDKNVDVPFGLCVWATGNAPVRVVADAIEALGPIQKEAQARTRGRLAVDGHLRVLGAKPGSVFALGDCAAFLDDPLPATAQVAAQQGEYLARLVNAKFDLAALPLPSRPGQKRGIAELFYDEEKTTNPSSLVLARPFQYLDLGILTYVGDSKALAQLKVGNQTIKGAGRLAFGLWRSVYLAKQVSLRNRLLILGDWVRTRLFGRDITRF